MRLLAFLKIIVLRCKRADCDTCRAFNVCPCWRWEDKYRMPLEWFVRAYGVRLGLWWWFTRNGRPVQ